MSYLIFIVATGLFVVFGAGGPLHRDGWLASLDRRIDAVELARWPALALRVAAPLIVAAIALWVLQLLLGGLGEAIVGTALLYFAWGRGDYPTELQRFLARARVGDDVGAAMLIDASGADEPLAKRALRDFAYRGFARWFPPVFYFWLLGPFAAAAYRLVELTNSRSEGRFQDLLHLLDWLPARLVLPTYAILGDFDRTRSLFTGDALDTQVPADVLLAHGVEHAWRLSDTQLAAASDCAVVAVESAQKATNRACAVWVILASLAALV